VPIGALTTENRDVWAKVRGELLSVSVGNKKSIDDIETAAFVVCLDDNAPVTKEEHSIVCWHGDGRNRFFDKSMQFIISDNGKAGFNGEHSNMEATITHRACDYICEGLNSGKIDLGDFTQESCPPPEKLLFNLNSRLLDAIAKAQEQFDELAGKHELVVCTYSGYGKDLIKTFKVSPDAYAQMAMQLAYYKMYRKPAATYESAGTRKYLNGRTETGRSVSVESVAWTKAMLDPNVSVSLINTDSGKR
jgi:carnitine O-acetyltransferase